MSKVPRRIRRKSASPVTDAALERIHEKLRNENELYKLHLKHYHMKLDHFKKHTSQLRIPADIYELYEKVVKRCETCSKMMDAPPRSKVSSLRSEIFGDLIFVDHGSVKYASASDGKDREYYLMMILDSATN